LKSAGIRQTGAAIGRRAGVIGRGAVIVGAAIAAYDAYQSYNGCMSY
jgi:hypothetical protein